MRRILISSEIESTDDAFAGSNELQKKDPFFRGNDEDDSQNNIATICNFASPQRTRSQPGAFLVPSGSVANRIGGRPKATRCSRSNCPTEPKPRAARENSC